MTMDRRELLGAFGAFAAARGLGVSPELPAATPTAPEMPAQGAPLPRKADFAIEAGTTYLNAAYTHPIPRVSSEAARVAAERRAAALPAPGGRRTPRELFARLVGARPTEIAHVSSTSAGENLVVRALGLDHRRDGNVVTDGLHFEGALMHLDALRRKGLDVRIAAPTRDARIEMRDLERLVDGRTRLVQVSATAMYNGFQHDLKAVAELAHAHGALVYADIVHAAGAEPLDLPATGVDFAACSSFKWLMADFGLGFLYAREAVWDRIERPVVGYYQASRAEPHYPPHLPAGAYTPVTYEFARSAAGFFEMGALTGSAEVGVALLATSLEYLLALGVDRIQAHRLPLIRRLQAEVPRLGFTPVTPPHSTAGVVTFARTGLGESEVPKKLAAAKVQVRVAANWMRISPSVYNDMADVERLLEALA
jgi:selenocysteine lyase/cysteine desulfurase